MARARPLFVRGVREQHPGKHVEVWFEDEARIGQQGTLTTVWAETGSRPRSVKQTEYQWAYASAAVNPRTGEALGLITEEMNTSVMNDVLLNLSRMLGEDRHAVLVWDNAGFHTSGSLEAPDNITLLPLPPYAPELNCVERIWAWMRSHDLSNRAFEDREHVEQAIAESCAKLDAGRIRSICRTGWVERMD